MRPSLPLLCVAMAVAVTSASPRGQLAPSSSNALSSEWVTGSTRPPLPGTRGRPEEVLNQVAEQEVMESPSWDSKGLTRMTRPPLPGTRDHPEMTLSRVAEQEVMESPSWDTEGMMRTTWPPLPGTRGHPVVTPSQVAEQEVMESPSLDPEVVVGQASAVPVPTEPEGLHGDGDSPGRQSTTAPMGPATEGPGSTMGTSAPPCPGEEELPESCMAPTAAQSAAVVEALGTFALRFYQHAAGAAEPGTNLLFSPINVAMGLSQLLLGARGETRQRLGAVLGYAPGLRCVHGALRQLAHAPGLLSAARIFHHPALQLQPSFLNASRHFYGAQPYTLSGNESLDVLRVNEWVSEATRGHLPRLLQWLPPGAHLLLLSAVHFQGRWKRPFRAADTVPLPFQRPARGPVLVPTMTSKKYPVALFTEPSLRAQVGRLELDGGLSLVLLVPMGALGALDALEQALTPAAFVALLRKAVAMPPRAAALALPRFRLDLAHDVVALVHDMDYGLFLDAELCGLAPGAELDSVRHRAVLALDEAGVEAAGATAASLARTARVLDALRPFLFVLLEDATGLPLFMGRLSDPPP
ncbi:plasma protease C1 inhibitor [Eudromia elegans]